MRTGLSVYCPWVFSPNMLAKKEQILEVIFRVWDKAETRIRSENYSLDFAVSPDLSSCWIVELNNFLPPLAGSGLFDYYSPIDRHILESGPFEFRLKSTLVTTADFRREIFDGDNVPVKTVVMQPASPGLLREVANVRRKVFGLPPLQDTAHEVERQSSSEKSVFDSKCSLM